MIRQLLLGIVLSPLALSATRSHASEAGGGTLTGIQAFSSCSGCHSISPAEGHKTGPNLAGVVGRPAASVQGYDFSPALSASGLSWTRENLFAWIAGSEQMVPGSWMLFHNPLLPEEVMALIDYLQETATESGNAK